MTGARQLAYDAILPLARAGLRVLDVGAGDAPLASKLEKRGCIVLAVDQDETALRHGGCTQTETLDLGRWERWRAASPFDLIVSVYALQHLMGREALGWLHCRECVADDGRMVVVGRFLLQSGCEMGRADPLNGYSVEGLMGLGIATGWKLVDIALALYAADKYRLTDRHDANAYVATLEPL